ncbi:MAG: hypothetical protein JWM21_3522 [Acidobacteria bacterium]|jgi:hypothetical protein|nr:hypothetical protein [Acidobacteriota bacterium]
MNWKGGKEVPYKTYARTLITNKEAANILCLKESTIRGRKAGTEKLTRIKIGKRGVRLILQEVEAHLNRLIAASKH